MKMIHKAMSIELSKNPKQDLKELEEEIVFMRCPSEYGMDNLKECNMEMCKQCFDREVEV